MLLKEVRLTQTLSIYLAVHSDLFLKGLARLQEPPRVLVLRLRLYNQVVDDGLLSDVAEHVDGVHLRAEVSAGGHLVAVLIHKDLVHDQLGAVVRRPQDGLEEVLGQLGYDALLAAPADRPATPANVRIGLSALRELEVRIEP